MSKRRALTQSEIDEQLPELSGWAVVDGKLHQSYRFGNFVEAFGFMTKVAILAERMDHHPEWSNVYNRVSIDLTTHDADNSISALDIELAKQIDLLA